MTNPTPDPGSGVPAVCWTFTFTCQHCHQTIQVTDGVEDKSQHPDCPEPPALVIEGRGGTGSLAERVEAALDDMARLDGRED